MSDQTPLAAEALGQAFATEMATAVAALAGETTSVTPGSSSGETAWLARPSPAPPSATSTSA